MSRRKKPVASALPALFGFGCCPTCDGAGEFIYPPRGMHEQYPLRPRPCYGCGGSGRIDETDDRLFPLLQSLEERRRRPVAEGLADVYEPSQFFLLDGHRVRLSEAIAHERAAELPPITVGETTPRPRRR